MRFTTYRMTACAPYLRTEGRVTMIPRGLLMDMSASGFTLRFSGSGITLSFAPYHDMFPLLALAVLDGVRQKFTFTDGGESVILECGAGEHTLTFLRLSEGGIPFICTEIRISALSSEDLPCLLPPPAHPGRKLTFFGDSITCGFGDLGSSDGDFSSTEEDPTRTYAYRTAQILGAEAELVSVSGRGIAQNSDGSRTTKIIDWWHDQNHSLGTPFDTKIEPDAVIINAGTNDTAQGYIPETFREDAEKFLRTLRHAYPHAEIVWFYGLMGLQLDGVLRELIDTLNAELGHLTYLPTEPVWSKPEEVGSQGHPSTEGGERAARELSAKLAELLGW